MTHTPFGTQPDPREIPGEDTMVAHGQVIQPQQEEAVAFPIKLVDFIWEELCEEDRSSPEDQPDMALVCRNDLLVYAEKWNERQAVPTPVQKVQESQTVSEEMVERAAKAAERVRMRSYEWTDEEFEIWWTRDKRFSRKQDALSEARAALTAALATP